MDQTVAERADRILAPFGSAYNILTTLSKSPISRVQPVVVMHGVELEAVYTNLRLETDPSDPGCGLEQFAKRLARIAKPYHGIGLRSIYSDTTGGLTLIIHPDKPV